MQRFLPVHHHSSTLGASIALLLCCGILMIPMANATSRYASAQNSTASHLASYGRLPLHFEPNHGQADASVQFLSRGPGYTLWLMPTEAVLALRQAAPPVTTEGELPQVAPPTWLRMRLVDATAQPQITGLVRQPGQSHYYIGSDPAHHHTHIPHFSRVQYTAVYPGIDLVFYGNQQQLEYYFIVAPGADPRRIKLAFEGVDHVAVDAQGDLVLHTAADEADFCRPSSLQRRRYPDLPAHSLRRRCPEQYCYGGDHSPEPEQSARG